MQRYWWWMALVLVAVVLLVLLFVLLVWDCWGWWNHLVIGEFGGWMG